MERLSSVILLCIVAAATAGESNPATITRTFRTNNGMYGVASIAGVTSRNGRVSSVSGVKFYPSSQDFYFPDVKSSDKLPEPITFSKEENGRITSGSIKIGPGSVSVSSSARSAFPEHSISKKYMKPLISSNQGFDDMFLPYPLATFNSRSFDPWFPTNFSFRQLPQSRVDMRWPYPTFSPFNYW